MPKHLSAQHKAKIAAGMRAYHAKCRACHNKDKDDTVKRGRKRLYPKSAAATQLAKATRKGPLKRLRKAGSKAKAPAKKKPRRVKLTTVPRPARRNPRFMQPQQAGESGGRSRTAGQRYMDNRVKGIKKKAKKLRGKDAAPEWAFSIKDRWAMDSEMM